MLFRSSTIYPGATEICDGADNNCNGQIDEDLLTTYYQDSDDDGYGNLSIAQTDCSQPTGYVTDNTDCDDTDNTSNPGAFDMPDDGIDQNCNGEDSTTTVIDPDIPVDGDIDFPGDVDTYDIIDATTGTKYTFTVTLGTLSGLNVTIYDADGIEMMSKEISSKMYLAPSLAGTTTPVEWTCQKNGTYHVVTQGSDPSATGTYQMSMSTTTVGDSEDGNGSGGGGGCFIAKASYEDVTQPSMIDGVINWVVELFE